MKTKYMHTIDGKPASFEGDQVCFSHKQIKLVDSLYLIRKQQKQSTEWRKSQGFSDVGGLGYVTIKGQD